MNELRLFHPIRVIGIGGGGNNAVDRMCQVGVAGVDFIAANTDQQALTNSEAPTQIHLGPRVTRGLGAGARPEIGSRAAHESRDEIERVCKGAELVFVTAGMGGGTGSGAAPMIARTAKCSGSIVVGVVTMPFTFEGSRRRNNAEAALAALREEVDTLVVVYNDRLLEILDPQHARMDIAFRVADECLRQAVEGITGLINDTGLINLDFADVKNVLREGGLGHFSLGYGSGEDGAQEAMRRALSSPLLGREGINGTHAVIANVRGAPEMRFHDITAAMEMLVEVTAEDAPIYWGTSFSPGLGDRVEVTLIAVGLDSVDGYRKPLPNATAAENIFATPVRKPALTSLPPRQAPEPRAWQAEAPRARPVQPEPRAWQAETPQARPVQPEPRGWQAEPPQARAVQPDPRGWQADAAGEPEPAYRLDDLSVPAFLRRRKRASA